MGRQNEQIQHLTRARVLNTGGNGLLLETSRDSIKITQISHTCTHMYIYIYVIWIDAEKPLLEFNLSPSNKQAGLQFI
jgi:hypothetical protein